MHFVPEQIAKSNFKVIIEHCIVDMSLVAGMSRIKPTPASSIFAVKTGLACPL
jgi:hypothetical protein